MAHDPNMDIGLVKAGVVTQVHRAPTDPSTFGPEPDGELVDFEPGAADPDMLWNGTALSSPPPSAPVAPTHVSMRQARLALANAGLYDEVVTAINAADTATKIWWDTSPVLERQNTVLLALATTLNLSSAQVDALFVAAAALP